MSKRLLALALVALLAFSGYWFLLRPNPVAAVVNGESIARKDLDTRVGQIYEEYARYGYEVTRELRTSIRQDVLDEMIEEMLLLQAARAAGIVITDAEVDEYYLGVAADYGGEDVLQSLIVENGYTVATFKAAVAEGLAIERFQELYIAENVEASLLLVTAAEVRERYDHYMEQYYDLPPLEEIASFIEEELRTEKLSALEVIDALVAELRNTAEISISTR